MTMQDTKIYALNFLPGDEILVASSTFHASLGPIKNLNCKKKKKGNKDY